MGKDSSYLFDIVHACDLIHQFTEGIDFDTFKNNLMRQDAVMRRIEIIGEASNKLSDEFKDAHPEIPWILIRGMRNRLVHEYNETDIDLVWITVHEDIPKFQKMIEKLLIGL